MKQVLLLFTFSFFFSTILLAQVPPNDLISNATLISSFPSSDLNVQLGNATTSATNEMGCTVSQSFATVFYKFTVDTASTVDIQLEDANGASITSGTSLAIVYSAPTINAVSPAELSPVSPCVFGSQTTLEAVSGVNYYVVIYRDTSTGPNTNIYFNAEVENVPATERDALISFYNSTNGNSWTTNTNWLDNSMPLSSWHGVTIQNNHVTRIDLGNNNLTGTLPLDIDDLVQLNTLSLWSNQISGEVPAQIGNLSNLYELDLAPNTFTGSIPPEIGNLANLEVLWLNQNGLTGSIPSTFQNLSSLRELYLIGSAGPPFSSSAFSGDFPDLTGLPLEILQMQRNYFIFSDIADEFATYQANIPTFIFAPQYTVDIPRVDEIDTGDDIILTLTDVPSTRTASGSRMASNEYQWYKDDAVIGGANANSYTISNAQPLDSGIYHCVITNSDVPGMEILRASITVDVDNTLSIEENDLSRLIIYPNPTSDYINIKQNTASKIKLSLFDISGRLILQQNFENSILQVNISNMQNGVYLLQIEKEGKSMIKRILKK